ncbi:hypothetical protein JCM33374_g5496 [Metschnikowia sp. JCM 33374]|nr:hypothetical protein JCM33374_g5496 [Metschnikowia sp. JCM 33374]
MYTIFISMTAKYQHGSVLASRSKRKSAEDPFAATTHFDGSAITNKVAKKLNKKRQLEEGKSDKAKKPPKRVKKPKSDRGPPPEKDQLAYLRQFVQDKENWKFSKQKQNWLLKNIEAIPDSYENELIAYFEDIQGGARTRVEDDLRAVINKWNEYSKKLEEKINAELYGEKSEEDESKTEESAEKATDSEEKKAEESGPSREYAVRCKKLLSAMLDEPVHLEGETEDADVQETPKEPEAVPEASQTNESESPKESDPKESGPTSEKEDNLIIDEVEVEEYDQTHPASDEGDAIKDTNTIEKKEAEEKAEKSEGATEPKKESKKPKKEKKSKKSKKDNK